MRIRDPIPHVSPMDKLILGYAIVLAIALAAYFGGK